MRTQNTKHSKHSSSFLSLLRILGSILVFLLAVIGAATIWDAIADTKADATEAVQTQVLPTEPDAAQKASVEPPEAAEESQTLDVVTLDTDAVQAKIDEICDKYDVAGAQVAVILRGEPSESFAYGWATIDEDEMTTEHKFRIASLSKVVVGMSAMLLQEDGIVDLDEDIGIYWDTTVQNNYYPDDDITIRDILHHTSTILSYGDDVSADYSSVLSRFRGGFISEEPGSIESYCYNNYAFRVLGMTLELAAGEALDDVLQRKLFDEMDIDASFASGDIEGTDKLVTCYGAGKEVNRSVARQQATHMPDTPGTDGDYFAGGLTISAFDYAKLIALLASDGAYHGVRLMSEDSVAQMESYLSEPLSDGSYQAAPLFYWEDLYGRAEIYCHTGAAYGIYSSAVYDPNTGDGIVIFTSGANSGLDSCNFRYVCAEINKYLFDLM